LPRRYRVELIFIFIALAPVTYLFIKRDDVYRARSLGGRILVASGWGVVYAVLVGLIVLPLGVSVGLGVDVWAFLR
jgi:hypothetical protein